MTARCRQRDIALLDLAAAARKNEIFTHYWNASHDTQVVSRFWES